MSSSFYSDRTFGGRPLVGEVVDEGFWRGLYALVETLLGRNYLAEAYPEVCPDSRGVCGTNRERFFDDVASLVPALEQPLRSSELPSTAAALDLVDLVCDRASAPEKPRPQDRHAYFGHDHLRFSRPDGLTFARERVNQIFARNGLVFSVDETGLVGKVLPPGADTVARQLAQVHSGDERLDELVAGALSGFGSRHPQERQRGLEQLWDALERVKSSRAADMKSSVKALLDAAAGAGSGPMRQALEECAAVSKLGNTFAIRHHDRAAAD